MSHFHQSGMFGLAARMFFVLAVGPLSALPAGLARNRDAPAVADADAVDSPEKPSLLGAPPAFRPMAPRREISGPHKLLEMFDIDDSQLDALVNGRPLHPSEDEVLVKILFRMPEFPRVRLPQWQNKETTADQLAKDPQAHRAELFHLAGRVLKVEKVPLIPESAERYLYDYYYRVNMQLDGSGRRAVVCARKVPRAWRPGETLNERASVWGLFLKSGDGLVFAADRVAWHPDHADEQLGVHADDVLLGDLGMDVGLFDLIVDRRELGISDRECFYQLLDAAGRADPKELRRRTRREFDLAPLLSEPKQQRGRLIAMTGTARRAVKIVVDDPDIQERFGIDHYYVIDVFVPTKEAIHYQKKKETDKEVVFGSRYPLTFCVRRLPEGMPEGDDIRETVRIGAFYFKLWAYPSRYVSAQNPQQLQIGPMLIGLEPQWIRPVRQANSWASVVLAALFVVALAGIWIGLWIYSRGDAEFKKTTLARQFELPEGKSLNDQDLRTSDEPDLSKID